MFKNSPRAPFCIFRHYATYRRPKKNFGNFLFFPHVGTVEENTWNFEVLLLFLSLRYGADLGRSRLVSNCIAQLFGAIKVEKRIFSKVLKILIFLWLWAPVVSMVLSFQFIRLFGTVTFFSKNSFGQREPPSEPKEFWLGKSVLWT